MLSRKGEYSAINRGSAVISGMKIPRKGELPKATTEFWFKADQTVTQLLKVYLQYAVSVTKV